MKIAVTGGGGFLGYAIVRQLLASHHEVVVVSRGHYPNLLNLGASLVRGDLADLNTPIRAFSHCDAVIHSAALAGIWGDPRVFERNNLAATRNVISACIDNAVPKLIFTSSPSVIFNGHDELNASQFHPYPKRFLADYPRTKALAEQLVLSANSPDLATTSLRPHLIWGKHDPHLIPRLIQRHLDGKLRIVGDGNNVVDMTHVDNAAHAHLLALQHLTSYLSPIAGKPYFISDDHPVHLWKWLSNLFHDLGLPPLTHSIPAPLAYAVGTAAEWLWTTLRKPGEPPMTRFVARQLATSHTFDMSPAKRDLGYASIIDYQVVYPEMVQWIRDTLL